MFCISYPMYIVSHTSDVMTPSLQITTCTELTNGTRFSLSIAAQARLKFNKSHLRSF